MSFDNIAYLQYGNKKQQEAYSVLTNHQVLLKLKKYDPILVGTIPINIDIENSDLDIICCYTDMQEFTDTVCDAFKNERNFHIREQRSLDVTAIVANFFIGNFEVEIFGQDIPTKQQYAYRHMIAEYNLLNKYGESFRRQIIELKRQGFKTEPAFGIALGLSGDPYTELLKFATDDVNPDS